MFIEYIINIDRIMLKGLIYSKIPLLYHSETIWWQLRAFEEVYKIL